MKNKIRKVILEIRRNLSKEYVIENSRKIDLLDDDDVQNVYHNWDE